MGLITGLDILIGLRQDLEEFATTLIMHHGVRVPTELPKITLDIADESTKDLSKTPFFDGRVHVVVGVHAETLSELRLLHKEVKKRLMLKGAFCSGLGYLNIKNLSDNYVSGGDLERESVGQRIYMDFLVPLTHIRR